MRPNYRLSTNCWFILIIIIFWLGGFFVGFTVGRLP